MMGIAVVVPPLAPFASVITGVGLGLTIIGSALPVTSSILGPGYTEEELQRHYEECVELEREYQELFTKLSFYQHSFNHFILSSKAVSVYENTRTNINKILIQSAPGAAASLKVGGMITKILIQSAPGAAASLKVG